MASPSGAGPAAGGARGLGWEGLGGAAGDDGLGAVRRRPHADERRGRTTTLFQLEGALLYVDDDNVVGFDGVLNHTKTYHDFRASQGIGPLDLDY